MEICLLLVSVCLTSCVTHKPLAPTSEWKTDPLYPDCVIVPMEDFVTIYGALEKCQRERLELREKSLQ
jgi:hypothetical protein